MQEQIERDLKAALLSRDRVKTETLKTLKSALLYEAVNKSLARDQMTDEQVQLVLSREAKKRQEAADMYAEAGESERAAKEQAEKTIIAAYLPEQMSEEQIVKLVEGQISAKPGATMADMGKLIGAVKAKAGASADGAVIARIVKEKLAR
jgi:uncharacterized protein YqeY